MASATPTPSSVLAVLPKARLADLGREMAVTLASSATKEQQIDRLLRGAAVDLTGLARLLTRDELKAVCKAHGLDDSGRSRATLATRILGGLLEGVPGPLFAARAHASPRELPARGDIVQVRHRQYIS